MKKKWKAVIAIFLSAGMIFTPVLGDELVFDEETEWADDAAAFAAEEQTVEEGLSFDEEWSDDAAFVVEDLIEEYTAEGDQTIDEEYVADEEYAAESDLASDQDLTTENDFSADHDQAVGGETDNLSSREWTVCEEESYYSSAPIDNRAVFEEMARAAFYPDEENDEETASSPISYSAGEYLPDNEKKLYDALVSAIKDVSEGRESKTDFVFSWDELGVDLGYVIITLDELGLDSFIIDGQLRDEVISAARERLGDLPINVYKVFEALEIDLPLDLYWYDGYVGISPKFGIGIDDNKAIALRTVIEIEMQVAPEFALSEYEVDQSDRTRLNKALGNVEKIVSENASLGDRDKLAAYVNTICEMTDYDDDARKLQQAGEKYNINVRNLINVFDGDPETKVISTGYSYAFAYLAQRSKFYSDQIEVSQATGTMEDRNNPDGHMWSIVRMDDGINYFTDVTLCDGPEDDHLTHFLIGVQGNVTDGYVVKGIPFYYYDDTIDLYGGPDSDALKLSACDYGKHTEVVKKEAKDATCTEDGYTEEKVCEKCGAVLQKSEVLKATGHTPDAGTITKEPTAVEKGEKAYKCLVCGEVIKTESIPKLEAKLKLSAGDTTMWNGKTLKVKASGMASGDSISKVSSSDSKIATVSFFGKTITIKSKNKGGKAKITVQLASGLKKTLTVTVQVKTTDIKGVPSKITVKKGKTYRLSATLVPSTSTQGISFKSSNTKVATVSSKGVIKGVKAGKAKITVTSGSVKKQVTVTVK